MNYLKEGKKINLEIAIDYSKSNKSYHIIDRRIPNDYEKVISDCCSIVSPYDEDQLFPVYGFGGIPPNNNGKVSHIFNINFEDEPEIKGFDQIIPTYKKSLKQIKLGDPCFFAPLLKSVYKRIKDNYEINNPEYINHYFILMILTNGIINDLNETIDILIDCSYIPLSVIIIGIGDGDFSNMDKLDGDEELLVSSKGEIRKRDLVQFVKYNKFKGDFIEGKKELKDEVLKEIPRQVEEYYELMENQIFEKNNEKNNIQQNTEIDSKSIDYLNFTKIKFYDNNINNNNTYKNTLNNNNNQNQYQYQNPYQNQYQKQYQNQNQTKLINLKMNETNYGKKNISLNLSNDYFPKNYLNNINIGQKRISSSKNLNEYNNN